MVLFTALTDNNSLALLDSSNLGSLTLVPVTGIDGDLLGIDIRPSNGLIYGLTTANKLYTIDASTGAATLSSTLNIPFEAGVVSGFDFNPVADRLRLVGDNDQNFRVNVETGEVILDGTLAFANGDANYYTDPSVTAAAYINSVASPSTTALYDIDPLLDALLLQSPPNDGTLITVGSLGIDFDTIGGFDVFSPVEGDNAAYAVSNKTFYSIDLQTGAATSIGSIDPYANFEFLGLTVSESPVVPAAKTNFVVLTDNNTLLTFNSATPNQVGSVAVTGIEGTLLGIDVRPSNGLIYGLTTANKLYTIDASTGAATLSSTLSVPFDAGVVSGFDFNPVADRLRLVGDNDQNFRINVETGEVIVDGTLAFANGDVNAGSNPNITAAAYINSVATPTTTALYDIDPLLDQLLLQSPPNDGTLITVGNLGIDFDVVGGFDVVSPMEGVNMAYAVSDETLYSIDLTTGSATSLGMIGSGDGLNLLGFTTLSSASTIPAEPMDDMPMDDTPTDDAPMDDMPMDDAPMDDMPMDDAPMDDAPTDDMPMDDAPMDDMPMETPDASETPMPDTVVSDETVDSPSITGLRVKGNNRNNRLIGDAGDDLLKGRGGNDVLVGDEGDDILIGGRGRDRLRGGMGSDTFVFKRSDLRDRPDVILDFEVDADVISLAKVFKGTQFSSDEPFADYVRIKGSTNRTVVQIDSNGDDQGNAFKSLVVLKGVDFSTINADSFLV